MGTGTAGCRGTQGQPALQDCHPPELGIDRLAPAASRARSWLALLSTATCAHEAATSRPLGKCDQLCSAASTAPASSSSAGRSTSRERPAGTGAGAAPHARHGHGDAGRAGACGNGPCHRLPPPRQDLPSHHGTCPCSHVAAASASTTGQSPRWGQLDPAALRGHRPPGHTRLRTPGRLPDLGQAPSRRPHPPHSPRYLSRGCTGAWWGASSKPGHVARNKATFAPRAEQYHIFTVKNMSKT